MLGDEPSLKSAGGLILTKFCHKFWSQMRDHGSSQTMWLVTKVSGVNRVSDLFSKFRLVLCCLKFSVKKFQALFHLSQGMEF